MMDDHLSRLLKWYFKQCDGDWEHGNGVQIGTIDNPGWYLKVCLDKTVLDGKRFQIVDTNRSEHDWLYCSIKDKIFVTINEPAESLRQAHFAKLGVDSHHREAFNRKAGLPE